jgi:uncharacterized protein GlcG (DUF336 family)
LRKLVLAAVVLAASAQGAVAEDEALVTLKVMTPETALTLAQAALKDCRNRGYQVAVAVVDRFGNLQVLLRDRFAGPHTPETARRKAWTAVSFRTDTLVMTEFTEAGKAASGVRFVDQALMVGGGVTVEAAGSVVGGIGVSGAPGGAADDSCARVGITAIQADLEF